MATLGRHPLGRAFVTLACGVLLLVAATIHAAVSGGYTSLSRGDMLSSRGSNQDLHLGTFKCEDLRSGGGPPCIPKQLCDYCKNDYVDTGNATGGGYNDPTPGTGSCGTILIGTCDATYDCTKAMTKTTLRCPNPPGPPPNQP